MTLKKVLLSTLAAIILTSCVTPQNGHPKLTEGSVSQDVRVMSEADKLSAAKAEGAFKHINIKRGKVTTKPTAEQAKIIANWQAIQKKYAKLKVLNTQQAIDIGGALGPLLAAADKEYVANQPSQYNNSTGQLVITPRSVVSLDVKGYCMDPKLTAAGRGEKFHLISTDSLISSDLLPLYRAVLAYGRLHPETHDNIQAIVWAIRTSCDDDTKYIGMLNERHFKILNESFPDGVNVLMKHINACHPATNIFQTFANEFKKSLNAEAEKFAESTAKFNDEMARIKSGGNAAPSSVQDSSEYTTLSPDVYARVVGTDQLQNKMEFLNNSNVPVTVSLPDLAAVPRGLHQIVEYGVGTNVAGGFLDEHGNEVMGGYAAQAIRFLFDKSLEGTSASTGMGKFFSVIAGAGLKNPALKYALNVTPILGNIIALPD